MWCVVACNCEASKMRGPLGLPKHKQEEEEEEGEEKEEEDPYLRQTNPLHTSTNMFHLLLSYGLGLSVGPFLSGFPT